MFGTTRCWRRRSFQLAIASSVLVAGAIASLGDCVLAQITPDGTLPNNSIVTPQGNTSVIEGGTQAGSNLFHSFEQFSVLTGGAAYFNNALDIQNIFSRVTGKSISNIDGLIRANGIANLFLLNPNGIIFGPNASLNIGGSFLGSTASSLNFADGTQFSATAHPTTPVLTVSVPLGLQYGRKAAGIGVQQSILPVQPDRTMALVGGDVRLDGGFLQAPGGRVELGGVADSGTVGLNVNGNNLRLSFPVGVRRADVSLTNGAFVDVIAGDGGSIAISAQNLDILEGSELVAGIGSVGSQTGDITLDATGAMKIAGKSSIANDVRFGAVGNAGNILIKAGTLSLDDGAVLSASTYGQGNAGEIFVEANNSVSVAANSLIITSVVAATGAGNGGDIKILAGDLFLTAGSLLETNTSGEGRAGNVIIDARDTVSVENSLISSETFGLRDGGIIDIKARALSLTEGAALLSRTTGEGNAGNIQINASDSVSISGINPQKGFSSGLITATVEEDSGLGGDIRVATGALRLLDGAVLSARTLSASGGGNITVDVNTLEAINGGQLLTTAFSQGRAGNITVNASDSITFSGSDHTYFDRLEQFGWEIVDPDSPASGLSARTEGTGAAGNLRIATGQLTVRDGAQVSASTSGTGQGGTLSVTAPKSVTLSGGASLSAQATADGNAGKLTINTLALTVQDGAKVSASTVSGQGGDITLGGLNSLQVSNVGNISASTETGRAGSVSVNANENAADAVQLSGKGSGLFAQATGSGNAGDLTINALALTVQDGAQVTVSSPQGRAGNLTATAQAIHLDQGKLTAETNSGSGGNIALQVQDLLRMRHNSLISAEALGNGNSGNSGNIDINTEFLVTIPSENSDIVASATRGGNIEITTSGTFGVQFREYLTPENDLTATGTVTFNTPDVDPSQGLVELPVELVDTSQQIASSCAAVGENKFTITGRGGLPPSPTDLLDSDAILVDLVTLKPKAGNPSSPPVSTNPTATEPAPIVEARGWMINNKGEVMLTATAPNATPHSPWISSATCYTPQVSS